MIHNKNTDKKIAIAGGLLALLLAGLKRRQLVDEPHHKLDGLVKLPWSEWKRVFVGTKNALGSKKLPTLAAGVAYYGTLAFFPFLAAAVAIAALLISPAQLDALVAATEAYLPGDIASVITTQLQNLVSRRADNLLAAGIAIAIALYGASGASKALVTASNVAYGVEESRGWLAQQAWGIIWTMAGIIFGAAIMALLAVNYTLLDRLGVPGWGSMALLYGRWLVLLLFSMGGLAVFYRYGPNRPRVGWGWVSWGASIATLVWLAATSMFFLYVQNFANYTQSYSLFAGIIALMMWLNFSALAVLVGADVNRAFEQRAAK